MAAGRRVAKGTRVEAALTAASLTSFCIDAFVKAGINAISQASVSVTQIRDARVAAKKRAAKTAAPDTRTTDVSQIPACMRAEVTARGDTGAERIE